MERIEILRKEALERKACYDEFLYKFYKKWSEADSLSETERYSEAYYYAFSNLVPFVS